MERDTERCLCGRTRFILPVPGILTPNGPDDPLPYYYHPVVGFLYRGRIQQALSLLNPPYSSILEIGYGSGILLPSLCSMSNEVYGIDIHSNPEDVTQKLAKIGVHPNLEKKDANEITYPSESFDLVVAISIFEHMRDINTVLQNILRVLRPNGNLLVGMPRIGKFMEAAFETIGYGGIEHHHLNDYRAFLSSATNGFIVSHTMHIPRWFPKAAALYHTMLLVKRAT